MVADPFIAALNAAFDAAEAAAAEHDWSELDRCTEACRRAAGAVAQAAREVAGPQRDAYREAIRAARERQRVMIADVSGYQRRLACLGAKRQRRATAARAYTTVGRSPT